MAQKTRRSFAPTIAAIAVLGVGAYFFLPNVFNPNGHKSEDQQTLVLAVAFMATPRPNPIEVIVVVGRGKPRRDPVRSSPWRRTITVKRGELVVLTGLQSSATDGSMSCAIRENDVPLSTDINQEPGGHFRHWVKCTTGR